jgi:cytochrome P450
MPFLCHSIIRVLTGLKYGQHIAKLHKEYGPIVRINPCEIHISDPDAYASIYVESSQRKSHKWTFSVGGVDLPGTLPMTADHDLHRLRRSALNQFFSQRQVLRLEPVVQEKLQKLQERLALYKGTRKPVNMNHAFSALTGDIVTQYCFARDYGVLDQPDFAPDWEDVAIRFSQLVHLFNQFPWLIRYAS